MPAWDLMPKDLSEENGDSARREPGTPLTALESLRREELDREGAIRRRLELAALEASGELGYRQLTVQRILDRSEVSRGRFYKTFVNKADCYAQGYATAIERLEGDMLQRGAEAGDWIGGVRAALEELARFLDSQPLLAKGLLAEVHVAGGAAMAKRKEVFERLSRAIDTARRENESRHSPPPITAAFILNAIEAAVLRTFAQGQPQEFAATVPDLVHITAAAYFGEEAARAAASGGLDDPGG
jgi:AcrR family transcriptional regulator